MRANKVNSKLTKQITELAGSADPDGAAGLALWAAKAHLKRGELEQAAQMLTAAAEQATDAPLRADIATQLLSLARTWGRQANSALAEEALQIAAELSPTNGVPALAQFLQRQKRDQEAINKWR